VDDDALYEMRLLDHLGFRPSSSSAPSAEGDPAEDQFFSYEAGGVVCPSPPGMGSRSGPGG